MAIVVAASCYCNLPGRPAALLCFPRPRRTRPASGSRAAGRRPACGPGPASPGKVVFEKYKVDILIKLCMYMYIYIYIHTYVVMYCTR